MTAEQFAYWLQGYAELNEAPPTAEQWQSIREHLALVFTKVTPPVQYPGVRKSGPDQWLQPQVATPNLGRLVAECVTVADRSARLTC